MGYLLVKILWKRVELHFAMDKEDPDCAMNGFLRNVYAKCPFHFCRFHLPQSTRTRTEFQRVLCRREMMITFLLFPIACSAGRPLTPVPTSVLFASAYIFPLLCNSPRDHRNARVSNKSTFTAILALCSTYPETSQALKHPWVGKSLLQLSICYNSPPLQVTIIRLGLLGLS